MKLHKKCKDKRIKRGTYLQVRCVHLEVSRAVSLAPFTSTTFTQMFKYRKELCWPGRNAALKGCVAKNKIYIHRTETTDEETN